MPTDMSQLHLGQEYHRAELAKLWAYEGWQAFSKGVFTPKGDNKLIYFVTKEKQAAVHQYVDHFDGDLLYSEGPRNHKTDARIVGSSEAGDELFLFFRERHHSDFTYFGEMKLHSYELHNDTPSRFVYETARTEVIATAAIRREQEVHGLLDEYEGDNEGKRRLAVHVSYERSAKNRAAALRFHGTICKACGFDFNAVYGEELALSYIEVHHVSSITTMSGRKVDPRSDLVPLCSNCHSMVHRQRGEIMPVEELRRIIAGQKIRNK